MKEADIVYEKGNFWVGKSRNYYTVYRVGPTHSVSDSMYAKTDDGLSIAKARCDYLFKYRSNKE